MEYAKLVLHVDDDPAILRLVGRTLERHGVQVVSVDDPEVVIEKLFETGARVVFLDIDMPSKDGLTLLREIKRHDAGIQVIMCTGLVSISTVLQSTALGAEGCIFKPIVNTRLITEAADRAFEKIDRWWIALRDWTERMKNTSKGQAAMAERAPIAPITVPVNPSRPVNDTTTG